MPNQRPKLRSIQPHPAVVQGKQFFVLQDPLQLAESAVVIPQAIAPLLFYCDGTRTLAELRSALMIRAGIQVSMEDLQRVIEQLDEALLLENERSAAAQDRALDAFRAAPFRPPSLAGHGYPNEQSELQSLLDGYLEALPTDRPAE